MCFLQIFVALMRLDSNFKLKKCLIRLFNGPHLDRFGEESRGEKYLIVFVPHACVNFLWSCCQERNFAALGEVENAMCGQSNLRVWSNTG